MKNARCIMSIALTALVALAGCKSRDEAEKNAPAPVMQAAEPATPAADEAMGGAGMSMELEEQDQTRAAPARLAKEKADKSLALDDDRSDDGLLDALGPGGSEGGERGPRTRAWFPETFLFEPLVVTSEQGTAELDVRVPDRLTTWRVLGLAHSRGGSQAGTLTTFLGTLPAYVDPVVPPFLRAGDQVRIPFQLVNTTDQAIATTLVLEATGAELQGAAGAVTIPARASLVKYATLRVPQPGQARILARLGNADSVVRTVDVQARGRPVMQMKSGTLARPRTFEITGPAGAMPSQDRARLMVLPGALAILRTELSAAAGRGGVADDAFTLLLAGKAPELLRAFGDEPDTGELRKLSILGTQRVVRHARVLDMTSATLLAEAALAHPHNPVLARLGQRAVQYLEAHQVPDGTCGGDTGWPLQRLLVATAECATAARSAPNVVIRASGAFERHAEHIQDPYTAAHALASGAVSGQLADRLRTMVKSAIYERPDGSRAVKLPAGVVRADGAAPSEVEATALALMALKGDASAPLADLGATLLAGYSPYSGWGDGRANLVCMQATLDLFKDPIPDNVAITLSLDGKVVAGGALDRKRVREVLILDAPSLAAQGVHAWEVRAEPAVPGLGFSLSLTSMVPWQKPAASQGIELAVLWPRSASVGKAASLEVRALVPSSRVFRVRVELPAGVQADTASLDALVAQEAISRYELSDGVIELFASPLAPAQSFKAMVRVIPTLAGTLHSGASSLAFLDQAEQDTFYDPPTSWNVNP